MRTYSRAALAAATLGLLVLSAQTAVAVPKPPARLHDARLIAQVRNSWADAINTLDVDRLLRLYAPGAVLFPEEGPAQLGVGAIGSWHGRWSARADVHYAIEVGALRFDGNRALEEWTAVVTITPRGAGDMEISGDPLQFGQHGVRVYRKDTWGRWLIDRETWSPDHPAAVRFVALARPGCTPTIC